MERFSSRESVVLGYRNSPSRSSSSSFSDALVDFQDVFGGPPRRVSVQDGRFSFNSDSVEDEAAGRVETRRNPWGGSGIGEKPVFGEATSRRNTSDAFFDDIFRSDSSPGSTIKRDLYASSVPADASFMSRNDVFGAAPQSSVPAKMNKGMEVPVFSSVSRSPRRSRDNYPPSPTLPSSSLARHGSQNQGDITNETQLLYRQSPLSVEFSFANDGSIKVTKSDKGNEENIMKESSTVSDSLVNSNQFHFSIYKWASKGAPPMIPFRGGVNFRLRDKSISKSMNDEEKFAVDVENEQVAAKLEDEEIASSRIFESKESKISRSNMTDKVDEQTSKMKSEAVLDKRLNPSVEENEVTRRVPDPPENSVNIVKDISDDFSFHEIRARGKSRTVEDLESNVIKEDEIIEMDKENKKFDPATKINENEGQGSLLPATDNQTISEAGAKPKGIFSRFANFGNYIKKQDVKGTISDTNSDVDKTSVPSSPGEGSRRRKVKEKVKEFVEMFNQDSSFKSKMDAEIQSQKSEWHDKNTNKADSGVSVSTKRTGKDIPKYKSDKKFESSNASEMVDKKIKQETMSTLVDKKKMSPITSAKLVKDILSPRAKKVESHTTESVVELNIKSSVSPITDRKKETFEPVKLDSAQTKKSSSRNAGISRDMNLAYKDAPRRERKKEAYQNDSPMEGKKIHPSNSNQLDKKTDGFIKLMKEDSRGEPGTSARKDTPSKKKDVSSPGTGSIPDLYQDANESLFDPIDAFEIKELTEELSNLSQLDEYQLALQESDAKIRLWSRGKEGNIRSLLTTLQNVLWPGSGWKPVALMDIIEANQVKRTYQRALLCLHPDKLQQKGAAEHQKYIAGKVFDILQESWNHFNTLTAL